MGDLMGAWCLACCSWGSCSLLLAATGVSERLSTILRPHVGPALPRSKLGHRTT